MAALFYFRIRPPTTRADEMMAYVLVGLFGLILSVGIFWVGWFVLRGAWCSYWIWHLERKIRKQAQELSDMYNKFYKAVEHGRTDPNE